MKKMMCPFCGKELKDGEKKQFTNTSDHVFDQNHEHVRPLRKTFVCDCPYSHDCFWDAQGGFYSGRNETLTYSVRQKLFPSRDCWPAVNSWDWWFSNKNAFADKVRKVLFFVRGNNRYFMDDKIAKFFFKFSEPEIQY